MDRWVDRPLCWSALFVFGKKNVASFLSCKSVTYFYLLKHFQFRYQLGSSAIIGLDITDAGVKVIIFAILMALCTTQTSATNFGIFMGFANLSTIIGNGLAPLIIQYVTYNTAFLFSALTLIPCIVLAYYLTEAKN